MMGSILVGSPEGERQHVHDALVTQLQKEHEVTAVSEGEGFLWELHHCRFSSRYDVILYDSGFLWGQAENDRRVELFKSSVTAYLRFANTPILVLADEEIQDRIRPITEQAGFQQIDCPYRIEEVVEKISERVNRV